MNLEEIFSEGCAVVIAGVFLTLIVHLLCSAVAKKKTLGFGISEIPSVITGGVIITLIVLLTPLEFESYERGGEFIKYFLPPATLALAYPLYSYRRLIWENFAVVAMATTVSVSASVLSMVALGYIFGFDAEFIKPALAKSVTAPVAIEITRILESPLTELCICSVFAAGMTGTFFGHRILKAAGVKNDLSVGLAMGSTSHVLGTSRCFEYSQKQASFSALVLVAIALFSALLAMLFALVLRMC